MQTTPSESSASLESAVAAQAINAVKIYGKGDTAVHALDGVDVSFDRGHFTAIMGPSGSGKSTLMHCLAGLDTLTSGQILIGGTDLGTLDDKRLTQLRRDRVGFIFQSFNLVPTLTAQENIALPAALAGRKLDKTWVDHITDTIGLNTRLKHRPNELSGGQQQRVAAARALAGKPEIIFADEPTGNLDTANGDAIMTLLLELVREQQKTLIVVTHEARLAKLGNRQINMRDGLLVN
jgi:putative ABC transport system ATP-binding protein